MPTSEQSTVEVKPAVTITEADVSAFIAGTRTALGLKQITVYSTDVFPGEVQWMVEDRRVGTYKSANSLAEALAKVSAAIPTDEKRAQQLREQAAKMLADADAIWPIVNPAAVEVA